MNKKMDEQLMEIIKKGESRNLEFKESLSLKEEIGKCVSAYANSCNGKILVGVSDFGEIKGVEIGKKTIESLANYIKQNTDNHVYSDIKVENVDDKKVIVIEVKECEEKPVFFRGHAYVRVGKSGHKLSASEIRKLAKDSGKKSYWDGEVCEGATLKDIDMEAVSKFVERYEEINNTKVRSSNKELLKSLGVFKKVENDLKITNAGILLFGKKPKDFFLMDYVTVARYPGKEKAQTYLDIKDFHGNLFEIIDKIDSYMREHVQEISEVIEGQIPRKIIPQYPYFVLRELITNAVCHRDYSNRGSRVIIRMFKDRIEFNSPGGLPNNITPKNIVNEQYSRNPVIADVLQKVKYIEKMGEGWDKIIDSVKKHPFKPELPKIHDTGNTVIVTLYSPREEFLEKRVDLNLQLNERQKKAVEYLKEEDRITRLEYEKINCVSKRTSIRDLNELLKGGVIKVVGKGPSQYYFLIE